MTHSMLDFSDHLVRLNPTSFLQLTNQQTVESVGPWQAIFFFDNLF